MIHSEWSVIAQPRPIVLTRLARYPGGAVQMGRVPVSARDSGHASKRIIRSRVNIA